MKMYFLIVAASPRPKGLTAIFSLFETTKFKFNTGAEATFLSLCLQSSLLHSRY